jgi:outer membrane lipoprotein carrier protein
MKKLLAFTLLAGSLLAAHASALDSLEHFVKTVHSGRADFTQVVTSPSHEGQTPKTKKSTGTFEFSRPNRFRFEYRKPFEQTIVADGKTLWLYDPDLKQVTARKQAAVLGSTPAALIASAPDLASLRRDFDLQDAGEKDGLQWVQATPKNKEGQLHSMKVGFRGDQLAVLEILDSFGQRSVLTFDKMEVNGGLAADAFTFKPPQGADVVRQ